MLASQFAVGIGKYLSLANRTTASFSRVRKAKFWKPKQCEALPPWQELQKKDPFEYPLRTKEVVFKEVNELIKTVPLQLAYTHYVYAHQGVHLDRNRKVGFNIDMNNLQLTKKQRARLIQLIGPRYKGGSEFKIQCDIYPEWEQNLEKLKEMWYELLVETKRAP